MIYIVSWKIFLFYSLLEGFRTSLQIFLLTRSYSSHDRVFKHTIFSKPILKTPTFNGRLDGRSCSYMLYSENHFKLEHDWVVGIMRYTLDLIVVSIGIIEFFQLVSILTFLCWLRFPAHKIWILDLRIKGVRGAQY